MLPPCCKREAVTGRFPTRVATHDRRHEENLSICAEAHSSLIFIPLSLVEHWFRVVETPLTLHFNSDVSS